MVILASTHGPSCLDLVQASMRVRKLTDNMVYIKYDKVSNFNLNLPLTVTEIKKIERQLSEDTIRLISKFKNEKVQSVVNIPWFKDVHANNILNYNLNRRGGDIVLKEMLHLAFYNVPDRFQFTTDQTGTGIETIDYDYSDVQTISDITELQNLKKNDLLTLDKIAEILECSDNIDDCDLQQYCGAVVSKYYFHMTIRGDLPNEAIDVYTNLFDKWKKDKSGYFRIIQYLTSPEPLELMCKRLLVPDERTDFVINAQSYVRMYYLLVIRDALKISLLSDCIIPRKDIEELNLTNMDKICNDMKVPNRSNGAESRFSQNLDLINKILSVTTGGFMSLGKRKQKRVNKKIVDITDVEYSCFPDNCESGRDSFITFKNLGLETPTYVMNMNDIIVSRDPELKVDPSALIQIKDKFISERVQLQM